MVHHFIVNPPKSMNSRLAKTSTKNSNSCNLFAHRLLKWATIKMVCITGLFLLTVSPFCFVFASAGFEIPKSTKWLDWTFFLPLLNGTFQPVIYVLSFERLREVFVKVIRCERPHKGGRTAMVLAIFRTTHSLSGNFVDNKKGVSIQKSREATSQVTILSDDASFEAFDTSQPTEEDSQQMSPLVLPSQIVFPQSAKSVDSIDDTNE